MREVKPQEKGGPEDACAARRDGFALFPVSLPFSPLGAFTPYQRAFYEGWVEAAAEAFAGEPPGQGKGRHPPERQG